MARAGELHWNLDREAFASGELAIMRGRGARVNRRWTTILGWIVTTIIISLNLFLLYQTFMGG